MGFFDRFQGKSGDAEEDFSEPGAASEATGFSLEFPGSGDGDSLQTPSLASGPEGTAGGGKGFPGGVAQPDGSAGSAGLLPQVLAPLSVDRIVSVLEADDYSVEVDDDGDPVGVWNGHVVHFVSMGERGEVLSIKVRLRKPIGAEYREDAQLFVEDWNRDHYWPKTYLDPLPGDEIMAVGEVNIDYEYGVSEAQLRQHIDCAISTGVDFLDGLLDRLGVSKES